jgi:very-short-patch-repair endonuclease
VRQRTSWHWLDRCGRTPTGGEAKLWAALRRRGLGGWRFRRQQIIAGYIVDFYCAELRLAVEVDGGVHDARRVEDQQRDQDLGAIGVRVVRVGDAEVMDELEAVLNLLAVRCETLAERNGLHRRDGYRTPKR